MSELILLSEWQKSQIEFWRKIEGYSDFDVSNFGNIRTWRVKKGRKGKGLGCDYVRGNTSRPVPVRLHRQGYLNCALFSSKTGKAIKFVHVLVAKAFVPNPMKRPEVNHITGCKWVNHSDGLQWTTRTLNIRHAFKYGLFKAHKRQGENGSQAKLTEQQVREIHQRGCAGESGASLAREFAVTRTITCRIINGTLWKHLNLGGQ